MKKVISFSLYKSPEFWENSMNTNFNKYVNGINENLKLIEKFYKDWFVYLYHSDNFNIEILSKFKDINNLELKKISDMSINAMQWRFLPNDDEDVELFIVRDADSRFTNREVSSVNEWINDGSILHIMRDHPHHNYHILGGMWGMRRQKNFNMKNECIKYNIKNNYNSENNWFDKWWDMNFLKEIIYPKYVNSSFINASYHSWESNSKPFSTSMIDNHFVGEIFKENNERDTHYKLL